MAVETFCDLDLIKKYDKPGPRYTSYPTAPLFSEAVAGSALEQELARTWDSDAGLSLYVHVPYCHTLCWYCGCNMKVSRKREPINEHVKLMAEDIARMKPHIRSGRRTLQVHFGGGTPSYLAPEEMALLVGALKKHFPFDREAEISIETDPRQLSDAFIETIKAEGFNRVSMGVQDLNPDVQKAINRIQPFALVADRVKAVRAAGFDGLNMDLMYGLPLQTPETFKQTLEQALTLDPDRIALFNFAYVPWMKAHMKLIKQEDMPQPEVKLQLLKMAVDTFVQAGYVFIGMDHFAKPDDHLCKAFKDGTLHRNFQGYTTHSGLEMLSFGMSAISMLDRLYVQNFHDIQSYETAIRAKQSPVYRGVFLNDDDVFRRGLINHLMCRFEVDINAIESKLDCGFDQYFPEVRQALDGMAADGLLHKDGPERYLVSDLGRLLIRNIAMPFDRYLKEMAEKKIAKFSRTV